VKRFISLLLIAFTLYWSFSTDTSAQRAEKRHGHYLVVQAESSAVPDLVKRTQKSAATGFRNVVYTTVILHWGRTLSWSPHPGSFLVSRFLRDCFYTFVSIHAP